jgi:hypothetical protein
MTAMGVQFSETGSCVGVLYPVSEKQLARFDRREVGYDRHEISMDQIDLIDYLHNVTETSSHYHDDLLEHRVFLEAVTDVAHNNNNSSGSSGTGKRKASDIMIWVYVPSDPLPPDDQYPIAQTYVDVILQGCLDIHADFAREFIEDTKGWNPQELLTDDDDDENDDCGDGEEEDSSTVVNNNCEDLDANDVIAWVNDRDRPIYIRADTDYSKKEGPSLDRLLREHRPEFRRRKRLTRKKTTKSKRATFPELPFPA